MDFIIDIIVITMALFRIVMPIVAFFWIVNLLLRLLDNQPGFTNMTQALIIGIIVGWLVRLIKT